MNKTSQCLQQLFLILKVDLHSTNVSCETDTICWRMVFFQSPFEANEMFCLLNKCFFFTNQKQSLKCVWQNSYLDLRSYTLYIIWQGVHLLVKPQAGGTNKLTIKMKSLTGICQGFDKCTKAPL